MEEQFPNWDNIKDHKCPLCGCLLDRKRNSEIYYCQNNRCEFEVAQRKYEQILDGLDRNIL